MLLTPAQIKPKSFESRQNSFSYLGWMRLVFTCVLWRQVASTVIFSTGTFRRVQTASLDSCVEIKECPFSGITKSGRIWRKVPESDARSVHATISITTG